MWGRNQSRRDLPGAETSALVGGAHCNRRGAKGLPPKGLREVLAVWGMSYEVTRREP